MKNNFNGETNPQRNLSFEENQRLMKQRAKNNFTGSGDPLILRTVTLRITNNDPIARKICLFPGSLKRKTQAQEVTGEDFDYMMGIPASEYGSIDTSSFSVSSSANWEFFAGWLRENPSLLNEIQVRSADTTQLNNPIKLYELTPFGRGRMNTLVPDAVQSQSDSNVQLVNVKTPGLQLDSITAIAVEINAGATVNFTFFIGTTNSAAEDLQTAWRW